MSRKSSDVQADVRESARKVWLAGLGALALAQEEGGKLFDTLVKRGEAFESRGSDLLKDARGKAVDAWQKVGQGMDDQVGAALHRLGVPSRKDIAALNRQVEQLTSSIEKMRAKGKVAPAKSPGRAAG